MTPKEIISNETIPKSNILKNSRANTHPNLNPLPIPSPQEVYHLATKKKWDEIPFSKLEQAHIEYQGFACDTLLHQVCIHKILNRIPQRLLTDKNLSQCRGGAGLTVYHDAASFGVINQIPIELLTTKKLTEKGGYLKSLLGTLIDQKTLDSLPTEAVTEELLLTDDADDYPRKYNTYAHIIARLKRLKELPTKVLTKKLLKAKDNTGNSVANYAARSGEIQLFDKEDIDQELMNTKNNLGENILHWAAAGAKINLIPQECITDELLSEKGDSKETVFHLAIKCKCLEQIPSKHLTDYNLTKLKDGMSNKSPLDCLISAYDDVLDKSTLKLVVKKLNIESLKALKTINVEASKIIKEELIKRKILALEEEDIGFI